jgi:hypothetical protein
MAQTSSLPSNIGSKVRAGCYLVRFQPKQPDPDVPFYEGTIRVVRGDNGQLRAAGDLYCRSKGGMRPGLDSLKYYSAPDQQTAWKEEAPKECDIPFQTDITLLKEPPRGIPVFPRHDYRAYLKVQSILENVPAQDQVTVRFDVHYFDPRARHWPQPGRRMIILSAWKSTSLTPHYRGEVIDDDSGQQVGRILLYHVSDGLRHATVRLRYVKGMAPPQGESITGAFSSADAHWNLTVSRAEVGTDWAIQTRPPSAARTWTVAELHELLVQSRARDSEAKERFDDILDCKWVYYLLCVDDIEGYPRGVMFDSYGSDSDNVPREAAAIGGGWTFPEEQGIWGGAKGKSLRRLPRVYARVALHELGHAMGLDHNHQDNGIMNTTDAIAENAWRAQQESLKRANELALQTLFNGDQPWAKSFDAARRARAAALKDAKVTPFPENVMLEFSAQDRERLQLGPDIAVRPGTVYESGGPFFADADTVAAEGLALEVIPLLENVPLGAPVRVGVRLRNTGRVTQRVPRQLSLGSGLMSGRVTDDQTGETRTFWPLKRGMDDHAEQDLPPGVTSAGDSLTLLRGAQGALFPAPGDYRIVVTVTWERRGTRVFVAGEATVRVSPAVDDAHLAVAMQLLNTPDTLLNLALGGHVRGDGAGAIDAACANPVLRPHFAVILAKRAATRHFTRQPDACKACEWMDESTVLSGAEIRRLAGLLSTGLRVRSTAESLSLGRVADLFHRKLRHLQSCGRLTQADVTTLDETVELMRRRRRVRGKRNMEPAARSRDRIVGASLPGGGAGGASGSKRVRR